MWKKTPDIDAALSVVLNNAAEITGAFKDGKFPEHECFEDGVQEMIASILKIDFSLFHGGPLPERWMRNRRPKGGTTEGDINRGTRVRTTQDAGRKDWASGARDKCQWGREGVVLRRKTGHGLCYEVLHEDGTEAWYDYDEVEAVNG